MEILPLWEILVPKSKRSGQFSYEHHKKWDQFVKDTAGGLTIYKSAKGEWISPDGKLYKDGIIPVRIACTEEDIHKIIDFTIKHYSQEAVMATLISEKTIIKYAKELN